MKKNGKKKEREEIKNEKVGRRGKGKERKRWKKVGRRGKGKKGKGGRKIMKGKVEIKARVDKYVTGRKTINLRVLRKNKGEEKKK